MPAPVGSNLDDVNLNGNGNVNLNVNLSLNIMVILIQVSWLSACKCLQVSARADEGLLPRPKR